MSTKDWRITRAAARRLVLEQDASRRERMPFFRNQPPLTSEDVEAAMPSASAHHAFWGDDPHRPRLLAEAVAGASVGQTITYCVHYSHADICNGGFHQYFQNSTGNYVHLTIAALVTLGEQARADLMRRAMARFPAGRAPEDRVERQELLDVIDYESDWKPWVRSIEEEYFGLERNEFEARIHAYEASHPNEYFLDD